ncbi:30S ribosomal protein S7 [Candidatus Gracilibacteria bacterium]|nr:MAG: 30S ribosomal protein S7 [Candidatus Gracilibacteria bacterium]
MSTKGSVSFTTQNERLQKFVNYLMKNGKKTLSYKMINNTFDILREKGYTNPEDLFDKAVDNVLPKVECRPKRVGGSIYQVPMDVPAGRQFALASRWILAAARSKKGKDFPHFLAQEIIDAATETGTAIKKKLDVYKMAEANKAFARFANNR